MKWYYNKVQLSTSSISVDIFLTKYIKSGVFFDILLKTLIHLEK